jgi:1-acyl-sn-glycerol-3-phosphate acyltransferase
MGSLPLERLPALREVMHAPLPHLAHDRATRWLLRGVVAALRPLVLGLRGAAHVAVARDPFILVANHSNRLEAMTLPTLLFLLRGGRFIHFIADWNFLLIPGIGQLMRRGEILASTRKDARPRFLNRFRARYAHPLPPFERARAKLAAGCSVGVFPEGTANRDPARLLRGRHGAARLSLESGATVLPCGIRFPELAPGAAIGDFTRLSIEIGPPLPAMPIAAPRSPTLAEVRLRHAAIMRALADLSGKTWPYDNRSDDYEGEDGDPR